MIDLKTVKEIRIAEGSVKKITNSSGVVLWEVKSTSEQTPCYYVAENVSDLPSTPKYDMAYITSEKSWYVLNNKSQWEKYGVIELVSSLDNLTTYDGKLVCNTTDKHEYKYTGGAWVDQGEVKVSTNVASLPSSFGFNYNAKNFDETTQTLKNDSGASVATDVVLRTGYNDSDSLTNYKIIGNDHITINSGIFGIIKGYHDYINRSLSNPTLTIIAKVSTSNGFSVFANRTSSRYNYMFRVYDKYLTLHGSSEQGQIAISKKPSIIGLTVDSSRTLTYFNKTDNLTSTYQNFDYGSINNGDSVLFEGYSDYASESWIGDFYWIFMSNQTLTENEIEDVINYNENGVEYVYPVSYEQYDAPNLNYTECANEAAMKALSCPYEGMKVKLTDTGKKYKFTYNSTISKYEWDEIISSLDVDLNNQWIVSTKKLDGYNVYMSNSNHNVNNGYASMKFKFKGMPDFKLWINSYAESCCDYTVAWNIDVDFPTSNPSYNSTGVKAHTQYQANNPTDITAFTEVDYPNDGGEHFVVVTYRKDYSVNNNDDRGYVAIKLTPLSTTWVVSSTEFIKKDDKYYEKLNEVGTYTDGVTANTGNYKEGNELTVTYKQGTADDYILVGSSMYYKKYAYVTPVNTEINTGDYIQGDYIGEATPSMKVTYTDNTEKTFYGLSSIEEHTDANKANATNVEIGTSVTSIGGSAFNGCSSLTSVTIPNSVNSIGYYAFYQCSSLTSITIPDSVTSIDVSAFENCSNLTGITIPNSVTSIGDQYTFRNCSNLKNIIISNSVTEIGWGTFDGCSKLESAMIPNGVTNIKSYAFNGCSSLTSVNISDSVTNIGNYAFNSCSSLTSVNIPDSVTNIGNYVFANCSNLTEVTIGNGLTDFGNYAFDSCSSLRTMTIYATTPPTIDEGTIPTTIQTIYVPADSVNDYKSHYEEFDDYWYGWGNIASKIKAIGS